MPKKVPSKTLFVRHICVVTPASFLGPLVYEKCTDGASNQPGFKLIDRDNY